MKLGRKNIFDPDNILKLVEMRENGLFYSDIARFFEVDHATIMYHYEKYCVANGIEYKKRVKTVKAVVEYCPNCEMMMSSKYHQDWPCQ